MNTHTRDNFLATLLLSALMALGSACTEPASADAPAVTAPAAPTAPVAEAAPEAAPAPRVQTAEPTPTPAPTRPTYRADALSVHRLALTREIEDREPVDASDTFAASRERLFAFLELRNRGGAEQELSVTFEGPDGRSTGHVMLSVPANVWRWRTWAWTQGADEPGAWTAQVRTADGTLISEQTFTIE